jgi:hypothetical protein
VGGVRGTGRWAGQQTAADRRDFRFLLSQFQFFSTHTRALAAETLKLERTLSDLVNHAYGLTSAEIDLMCQTAPPRMRITPPFLSSGMPERSQPPGSAGQRWEESWLILRCSINATLYFMIQQ